VNHFGEETPDKVGVHDSPRYGSGYGTLWICFSFYCRNTHAQLNYRQRVETTKALMENIGFTAAAE